MLKKNQIMNYLESHRMLYETNGVTCHAGQYRILLEFSPMMNMRVFNAPKEQLL